MPPFSFFFFNDTATTEIYTLSLHDALPISNGSLQRHRLFDDLEDFPDFVRRDLHLGGNFVRGRFATELLHQVDRKSTRLNSSHSQNSYAVFCLKKKRRSWQPKTRRVRFKEV